jgi:hypothetical protein
MNKAGLLPSAGVMLSLNLKRYYEPLRLPLRPAALSFPYTRQSMVSPPPQRASRAARSILHNMPPLLPRESMCTTSVIPAHFQRPSPFRQRVSFSNLLLRGYVQVHLRCGLLLCPWETYDLRLLGRRFLVLERRTDNSFHGTLTRWINRRSRRTLTAQIGGNLRVRYGAESEAKKSSLHSEMPGLCRPYAL